jgi:hypothetical protein
MPAAGKPGGLPAGAVSEKRRSINAEQARQVCWAVDSNRERASRQVAGRRLGQIQLGWEAGSLLAQAQTGNEQAAQSVTNHRTVLEQTSLNFSFRYFENSRNVEVAPTGHDLRKRARTRLVDSRTRLSSPDHVSSPNHEHGTCPVTITSLRPRSRQVAPRRTRARFCSTGR